MKSMSNNQLKKGNSQGIDLGGAEHLPIDDKKLTKALKKVLSIEVPDKEQIKVKTNDQRVVDMTLYRDGTTEKNVLQVFADPKATKDQRDSVISNYLWAMGKENASFIMELYKHKGQHTKETTLFKNQMRQDYEVFADFFVVFLKDMGTLFQGAGQGDLCALCDKGSEILLNRVNKLTNDRMREKGYGIYMDRHGVVFDTRNEEVITKVTEDVEYERNIAKQTTSEKGNSTDTNE
jgi:hypothetical protein